MSDKYAIIQLDGKQFKVTEGLEFKVNSQEKLNIGVLLYSDGKVLEIGNPLLTDVEVKAKIIGADRAPKIIVARFKSKSRYRKVKGHTQPLSIIKIESIGKKETKEKKEVKADKADKEVKEVKEKPVKKEVKKATSKKVSVKGEKK